MGMPTPNPYLRPTNRSLVSAEMGEPVGISYLYPIVPIMNFLSMVLMLLLVPGFWKTRIVVLVSLVGWVFLGNLVSFLAMTHWRGHTNDAPVWASILAFLRSAWYCGFFTSIACFAHFTCQRLQPLSARQLYDTRRRDNFIHLFFTLILPVLWAPLYLLSCEHRYQLIEDFGPIKSVRGDWPGFVVYLPPFLGYKAVVIFNGLALIRYWHVKQEDMESDLFKHHPSVRTRKLLLMAVVNTLLAAYGIYNQVTFWWEVFGNAWVPPKSLTENISSLQSVFTITRTDLDTSMGFTARIRAITAIFVPLLGFYVFAWFGCGAEARKTYRDDLLKLGRLVGVVGTLSFSWAAIAPRKCKPHQGLPDPLPLIPPGALNVTPYISPLEHGTQFPAGPTMDPSNPVRNLIDSKRRAPPKVPARRLSIHKPPFVPLNPANAETNLILNSAARRKQPLVPLDPTNTAVHTIASVPGPPARRLSYHKPAFRPLDPENPIPNHRQREELAPHPQARHLSYHKPAFRPLDPANLIPNHRQQEELAPRPQARRLSYHKPPFRPFVPTNVNTRGAIPDTLGTSMPLVDIQRRPESSGATGLPVESTVDALPPPVPTSSTSMAPPTPLSHPPAYLAPPPLSSRPTCTAPSSLSSQRTPTPAPPYRDMNTFFGRAT